MTRFERLRRIMKEEACECFARVNRNSLLNESSIVKALKGCKSLIGEERDLIESDVRWIFELLQSMLVASKDGLANEITVGEDSLFLYSTVGAEARVRLELFLVPLLGCIPYLMPWLVLENVDCISLSEAEVSPLYMAWSLDNNEYLLEGIRMGITSLVEAPPPI